MPPIHRVLIKTHHMTSRRKILTLTRAASNLQCSVLLKTGPHPPGIMLAEGESADDWLKVVKKLRYKDFRLMAKDEVAERRFDVEPGKVIELTSMKEFAAFLERDPVIYGWWRAKMGFTEN
ncbi:hypothetical protein N431DRAFT_483897 [Stipitochalara longipes BDJ]|nr:hypothetical protein N431DRAFT_483897 [Stipitochalara longipes BDJ]